MKRSLIRFSWTVLALFLNYSSQAAASIDISGYDSGGNFLGLAVDPVDHHVFLTGLGHGGGPKLWEFAADGTLVSAIIPIGLQPADEIASIVVGKNSHLLITVVYLINISEGTYEWRVVEIDRAGTTVYSSFTLARFTTVGGIDPVLGKLFLYLFNTRTVFETTAEGSVINSFDATLQVGLVNSLLYDIAYNPLTRTVFGAYMTPKGFILVEYRENAQGRWKVSRMFDLSSTGLSETFSLDIDPSTGLFYMQDMSRIVSFSLNDLTRVPGDFRDFTKAR